MRLLTTRDWRRIADFLRAPRRVAACLILAAAAALSVVRCTSTPNRDPLPQVKVLLDRGVADAGVDVDGPYSVLDERGAAIANGRRLVHGRIRSANGRLELNGVPLDAREIVLTTTDAEPFEYAGRRYAGDLHVRAGGDGRVDVQNVLDIEEYVAGVLFSEMPSNFPEEALKAQVVAARTYARYRLDHGDALLRATDADQVYGGTGPKSELARELVATTRGIVLESGGQILPAYFSSTCGGATIDGARIFKGAPTTGLVGVPCDWCKESPKWRWTRSIARAELERRLLLAPDSLQAIAAQRDDFGHSLAFDVNVLGTTRTFAAQEFRRLWNGRADGDADKLPSAWLLSLNLTRQALTVDGAGFGHAVGLCQYGAAGLARAGKDWRAIVNYYYRGAALVRRW